MKLERDTTQWNWYGDATHIVSVFQLSNPRGPFNHEGLDDGELGAGRSILKVLKQKNVEGACVFIVHYYGGLKMGGKHFEIYSQLAVDILDKMMPNKIWKQKVPSNIPW